MHNIFISYRRDDNQDAVGRIVDRLKKDLPDSQIFKDVDAMLPGADFRKTLSHEVGRCDALLAIVGQRWLEAGADAGKSRLEDPHDFVRIEIESAIARDVLVIPVLVANARMPKEEDLPPSLSPFAFRHAAHIRPDPDFHRDMDGFVPLLRQLLLELDNALAKEPIHVPVPAPATALTSPSTETAGVQSRAEMYLIQEELVQGERTSSFAVAAEDTALMGLECALEESIGGYVELDGYRIYTGRDMRRVFSSHVNFSVTPGNHTITIGFDRPAKVSYVKILGIYLVGKPQVKGLRLVKDKD